MSWSTMADMQEPADGRPGLAQDDEARGRCSIETVALTPRNPFTTDAMRSKGHLADGHLSKEVVLIRQTDT